MAYKLKSSVKSLCSSSALPNLKSGGKMISSDKGSSNYMKEKEPAAYMKGSAILQGGRKRIGGSVSSASAGTNVPKPLSAEEKAFFNTSNLPTKKQRLADEAKKSNTVKPKKVVKEVVKKETKKEANGGPSAAQTAASKLEKRAKTAISKRKKAPKTEDGVNAVRDFQANKKKKASEPKEMSRKQIREAKKKDKDSGMSRKEVRANKLKRKAASAKAKGIKIVSSIDTTKPESSATKAKQTKAGYKKTKSVRLEKKAAKIKDKVKA
tara:strand:+ start:249 stop:1046 length:798 start_codon:yes stop_codon:yes gene_type:complete